MLLSTFVVLAIAVHCIPRHEIEQNVIESANIIEQEGAYKKILGCKLFQLDNYTDALMLNIAISADSSHPIEASMLNEYTSDGNCFHMASDIIRYVNNDVLFKDKLIYGRYWHGNQVVLRPLLIVMGYNGIRILNYVALFSLLMWLIVKLRNEVDMASSVLLVISLLAINFPMVPLSMQFSACFYIAFVASISILKYKCITKSLLNSATAFFVIGGICSYFDLLTTPQITLCLPLLVFILKNDCLHKCKLVILLMIAWCAGYGLLWTSKWCVCWGLTGENVFYDALYQVYIRIFGFYRGMELSMSNIMFYVWYNLKIREFTWILFLFVVVVSILCYVYFRNQKGKEIQKQYLWLLLVSSVVPVWFFIIREHSIQHGWFTWRALFVSLYSFLLWLYYTVRNKKC